jgi:hypothetical protein
VVNGFINNEQLALFVAIIALVTTKLRYIGSGDVNIGRDAFLDKPKNPIDKIKDGINARIRGGRDLK